MADTLSPSSRDKILEVAEARFAQRGYAGVGLRELAEAAELSKSALFHHFPSKAALYCSVLEGVLRRLETRLAGALGREGAAAVRLDALLDALIAALAEHPTNARLLLRALFEDDDLPEEGLPEADAMNGTLARVIGAVEAVIEQGIREGSFRQVSARHTLQTLIGITVYHFASGDFGHELLGQPLFTSDAVAERRREVKAFVRHGLLRPGTHASDPSQEESS